MKAELAALETEYRSAESALVEQMALTGVQSMNVDGYNIHRKVRRKTDKIAGVDMKVACQYLDSHGLGFMVGPRYSWQTLNAYVCETLDDGERSLPEQFSTYFHVYEEPVIGIRKA